MMWKNSGVGGILLDMTGNRFCNELGRRDYVTGMMWKNAGVTLGQCTGFFLCLNGKASKEIEWHCKHYKGRGIMKSYANMEATFKDYNMLAEKQTKDPENGPYEAYGGGKSWASGARSSSTTCRWRRATPSTWPSSRR